MKPQPFVELTSTSSSGGNLSQYVNHSDFDTLSDDFLPQLTKRVTCRIFERAFGQGSLPQAASFDSTYHNPDFHHYNHLVQETRVGLGFAPGDVLLRI